ncbi:N-acetylmuramoyl-L-alanine amidase family protein [Anaerovorax odorimutans]|uniref:N-acetylmuramoyl-L-alanine amidase family protein n=1 Tax=Anaerovorax odorimutans TaxID=109327 RepID=UPI00047F1F89|nr:N-acetylmuramoyl-L-alanine amidase family protein [Anaerovorax odorimutans]
MNKKRIILTVIVLAVLLIASCISVYAQDNSIILQIDGEKITTDVAPVIKSDRTLVPARAVFEAIGGTVYWEKEKPSDIGIEYKQKRVDLKINSNIAYVDGEKKILDVPAQLVNDRTLIPVRFVSESLKFDVEWDGKTRTVSLISPSEGKENEQKDNEDKSNELLGEITGINFAENDNKHRITITANEPILQYSQDTLTNPNRFFIDISNFGLNTKVTDITVDNAISVIKNVRSGFDENEGRTRIVVDLKELTNPVISFSQDKKSIYLDFAKLKFDPMGDGKLVVMLDPGHGKSTAGKRSCDESLMEYEFNRDIANRIRPLLEAEGIEVLFTVEDDTDPSLKDRCSVANTSDADIYVSIHANAFGNGDWNKVKGWEIYVYKKGGIAEELAKSIQDETIKSVDIQNRGLKEAEFYVIKYTDMPAVLIEHGFYTNLEEVELLKSPEFRQKLAEADANGIINFFKPYKE